MYVRVLIAESFDTDILEEYSDRADIQLHDGIPVAEMGEGIHLCYYPDITTKSLAIKDYIRGMDALLVRPKKVTVQDIDASDKLKLIIRGGAGVNSIALDAAKDRGIIVANTPGQNSTTTAEYTFMLLMELLGRRQWIHAHTDVMRGLAGQPETYAGRELRGKRLAVIGMGNIGAQVTKMAQAFDMSVIAYSRSLTPEKARKLGVLHAESIRDAVYEADAVTLHLPLSDSTHHIIGSEIFAAMRSGTILINTARPALIDPKALEAAIRMKEIGGLAIDGDLAQAGENPNELLDVYVNMVKQYAYVPAILTPHIADTTKEAQQAITRQCLEQLIAYFEKSEIINRVA